MGRMITYLGYCLAIVVVALELGRYVAIAEATEVTVVSAAAVHAVVTDLAEAFQHQTGHTVKLTFGTAGEVQKWVEEGTVADVVILPDKTMERLAQHDRVVLDSRRVIARVGVGIGVREGAPQPDISNTQALTQALLAAQSIVYSNPARGGVSGIHFARLIERLGIAQALKGKTMLETESVCEQVAQGKSELCVHQISEILPVKGVTLVGPLPQDVQHVSTFSAVLSTRAKATETARAFVAFLVHPSFHSKYVAAGLDYHPY